MYQESQLQQMCVRYFRYVYPQYVIYATPNGGTRNPIEAKRLKAEGVLAGVADLTVLLPQGRIIYIEMKVKGNRQTDNQKAFQQKAEALGYKYYVCYSFDQFKAIIEEELNTTDN
nr:MAG TPA: Nuclease [Caudoviricetes sp.]